MTRASSAKTGSLEQDGKARPDNIAALVSWLSVRFGYPRVLPLQFAADLGRRTFSLFLALLIAFNPFLLQVRAQQLTPTPGPNGPGIAAAPNGVPLVDIVTPNSSGLSHNQYLDYNVGTQGLILNNHDGEVGTSQLGGLTPGNANLLNSGPATIILNEVTSTNRSQLDGYTEVFGNPADVIVANPNGITCQGCGFLNTSRATLTTGRPEFNGDSLTNFRVEDGDVTFKPGSDGITAGDFTNVDLFDVVSRKVKIEGNIHAKHLRISAGRNIFAYQSGVLTKLADKDGKPEYGIDSTAMGGMYAGQITLRSTEAGVGVRTRGDMASNTGQLTLSSNGKISLGRVDANQGIRIRANRNAVKARQIRYRKKLAIEEANTVEIETISSADASAIEEGNAVWTPTLAAEGGADIDASGNITIGTLATIGDTNILSTHGSILLTGQGMFFEEAELTAQAGFVSTQSLISHDNLTITAAADLNLSGDVLSQGNITLTGQSLAATNLLAGLDVGASFANGSNVFGNAADITINATSGSTGSFTAGSLITTRNADINAQLASVNLDTLFYGNAVEIDANTIEVTSIASNAATQIAANPNLWTPANTAIGSARLTASQDISIGTITTTGQTTLASTNGNITVAGTAEFYDDATLTTQSGSITAQSIQSGADLTITSGSSLTLTDALYGTGDVVLGASGTLTTTDVIAGLDLKNSILSGTSQYVAGSSVTVTNTGTGATSFDALFATDAITITGNQSAVSSDLIAFGSDLLINAGSLDAGDVYSHTASALASSPTSWTASLGSTGSMGITTANTLEIDTLQATGQTTLTATSGNITLVNKADLFGNATLTAGGTINTAGIDAYGTLTITAAGAFTAADHIFGQSDITLAGQSLALANVVAGIDLINAAPTNAATLTLQATNGTVTGGNLLSNASIDLASNGADITNVMAGIDLGELFTSGTLQNSTHTGLIELTATGNQAAAIDTVSSSDNITIVSNPANTGNYNLGLVNYVGTLNAAVSQLTIAILDGRSATSTDLITSGALTLGQVVLVGIGNFTSTGGSVSFTDTATLLGATTIDAAGSIQLANIIAQGTFSADANQSLTGNGSITGGSTIDLTAGTAMTLNGNVAAQGNVTIEAGQLTAQNLASGLDFVTMLESGATQVAYASDLTVTTTNGSLSVNQAIAGQDVELTSTNGGIAYSAVQGARDVIIDSGNGSISLNNRLIAGRDLTVDIGNANIALNSDNFIAGNIFFLTAGNLDLSNRTSVFNGADFTLSGNLNLTNGTLVGSTSSGGSGDIQIAANTILNSTSTVLAAQGNLGLDVNSLTNAGELIALNDLFINASGNLTNQSTGLIYAANDAVLLVAGTILNDQGAIMAGNDLVMGAGLSGTNDLLRNTEIRNTSGVLQAGNNAFIATNTFINERSNVEVVDLGNTIQNINFIADQADLDQWWANQGDIAVHEDGYLYSTSGNFDISDIVTVSGLNIRGNDLINGDPVAGSQLQAVQYQGGCLTYDRDVCVEYQVLYGVPSTEVGQGNGGTIYDPLPEEGLTFLPSNEVQAVVHSEYYVPEHCESANDGGQCSGDYFAPQAETYLYDFSNGGIDGSVTVSGTGSTLSGTPGSEATLIAGGNISIDAGSLVNDLSAIEAGGNAVFEGGSFDNTALNIASTTELTCNNPGGCELNNPAENNTYTEFTTTSFSSSTDLSGTVVAGGTVSLNFSGSVNNGSISQSATGSGLDSNPDISSINNHNAADDQVDFHLSGATGPDLDNLPVIALNKTSSETTTEATTSIDAGTARNKQVGLSESALTAEAIAAVDAGAARNRLVGLSESQVTSQAGADIQQGNSRDPLVWTAPDRGFFPWSPDPVLNTSSRSYDIDLAAVAIPGATALFQNAPANSPYLVESRSQYLNIDTFHGSQYFIDRIDYEPEREIRLLGDAFFEAELVASSIRQQTGASTLGTENSQEQYRTLVENGVAFAESFNIVPGVELSLEQQQQLEEPVVIYVEKQIGGETVLAPEVYLPTTQVASLNPDGALIRGGEGVAINSGESINNSGTIQSDGNVSLIAEDLINLDWGDIEAGTLVASAGSDIIIRGTGLDIDNNASLTAQGTVVMESLESTFDRSDSYTPTARRDLIGNQFDVGGDFNIASIGGGIDLTGQSFDVGGTLDIYGGGDITFDQTDIDAGGLDVRALDNIDLQLSSLVIDGNASIAANGDVTFDTVATSFYEIDDPFADRRNTNALDKLVPGRNANGSTVADTQCRNGNYCAGFSEYNGARNYITQEANLVDVGGDLRIASVDGGVNIIGNTLEADGALTVQAGNNVNITSAIEFEDYRFSWKKKKLFRSKSISHYSAETTNIASALIGGSVALTAGEDLVVLGSDIFSEGDITLGAQDEIVVASAVDTYYSITKKKNCIISCNLIGSQSTTISSGTINSGSIVDAANDLASQSGADTTLVASTVNAGGTLTMSAGTEDQLASINILSGTDTHHYYHERTENTVFSFTDNTFWITRQEINETTQDQEFNVASVVRSDGDMILNATSDINIMGSVIDGAIDGGLVSLSADRDINIFAGRESFDENTRTEVSGFGTQFSSTGSGFAIFQGYMETEDGRDFAGSYSAASVLQSGGDLFLGADNNVNQIGSDIYALNDINITAGNDYNSAAALETEYINEFHRELRIGITTSVSVPAMNAAQSLANSIDVAQSGYGSDRARAIAAISGGMQAYDALNSIAGIVNAGTLVSVNISAGFSETTFNSVTNTSNQSVSSVYAGNDLTITTGNDFNASGTDFYASNDAMVDVEGEFNLAAVENTSTNRTNSESTSASVGVSVGIGVTGVTVTPTASFSNTVTESNSSSATMTNARIVSGNTTTVLVDGDANLIGGRIEGTNVIADIEGDLNIESVQSANSYERTTDGFSVSISGPSTTTEYAPSAPVANSGIQNNSGTTVNDFAHDATIETASGGIGIQYGRGSVSGLVVHEQAGIVGNTVDVDVEGNTDLIGGVIIAEDDENSSVETGTLTYSDLNDHQNSDELDISANVNINPNEPIDEGGISGSASGSYAQSEMEQETRATVTPEITITNPDEQTQDLVALNTDPDLAQEITHLHAEGAEFYVSESAVRATVKAVTETLRLTGVLSGDAADLLTDIQNGRVSGDILSACGTDHGWNRLNLFHWLVSTAHADEPCKVEVNGREYVLSAVDVANCETLIGALQAAGNDTQKQIDALREVADAIRKTQSGSGSVRGVNQILYLADLVDLVIKGNLPTQVDVQNALDFMGTLPADRYNDVLRVANCNSGVSNCNPSIPVISNYVRNKVDRIEELQRIYDEQKDNDEIVGYESAYPGGEYNLPITASEQARRNLKAAHTELVVLSIFAPTTVGELVANMAIGIGATAAARYLAPLISRLSSRAKAVYDDIISAATNSGAQVVINRQNGAEFEQRVIDALGPVGGVKNTTPRTVTLSNGTEVTTIPDLWGRNVGGVLEAKNVQNLSLSPQLRAQAQIAREAGEPVNLVVSPRTQRVSGPLLNDVRSTGGDVYNPATDSLTPW